MKLCSKKTVDNNLDIRFCGIPLFVRRCFDDGGQKRKILGGLIKIVKKATTKSIYILGIRVRKIERQDYSSKISSEIISEIHSIVALELQTVVRELHIEQFKNHYLVVQQHQKVFTQFKDIHKGATGALLGCGPSLNYYKRMPGGIHFGVNTSFSCIKPDYWFSIDSTSVKKFYNELSKEMFAKFIGQALVSSKYRSYRRGAVREVTFVPDCVIESFPNAHKYYIDHPSLVICRDISLQPLPDLGSAIFSALSFAIYSGCKKIFIVGCDNVANGYFNGEKQKDEWKKGRAASMLLNSWKIYKEHIEIFHPDVELISVNPVGLQGLFKDVYTAKYLQANPDVREKVGGKVILLEDMEA